MIRLRSCAASARHVLVITAVLMTVGSGLAITSSPSVSVSRCCILSEMLSNSVSRLTASGLIVRRPSRDSIVSGVGAGAWRSGVPRGAPDVTAKRTCVRIRQTMGIVAAGVPVRHAHTEPRGYGATRGSRCVATGRRPSTTAEGSRGLNVRGRRPGDWAVPLGGETGR